MVERSLFGVPLKEGVSLLGTSLRAIPLAIAVGSVGFLWTNRPAYVPSTIPGPKRYPIVGILGWILQSWPNWPIICLELSKKFKHVTWGGPVLRDRAAFFTDNPDTVRHILKDNFANYEKGTMFRLAFRELLGTGIFAADGKIWEAHRKVSSRMFSRNLLKSACDIANRNCQVIINRFEKKLAESQGGCYTLDLQDLFYRLAADNTAESTFGISMQSLQTEPPEDHAFVRAFDDLQLLCQSRVTDPIFDIKQWLGLTPRERRIQALKRDVDAFCQDIIDNKRREISKSTPETSDQDHEDLLSLFVRGSNQSDLQLRDMILNFMLAGRDTTSTALSWTLYELTKRPDVVTKVIEEVHAVCGESIGQADYSYETIGKLKYTHCVVMEALRLHPSVPLDQKYAVKDDTLPDGTFIPAGSVILYLPLSMGHNEQIYGVDASEFRPERFEDQSEPSAFSYTAFNAGPRMCLGKPMALVTMKVVLAQLLPRFQFVDKLKHSGDMEWLMVGKMKGGFEVEVTARNS